MTKKAATQASYQDLRAELETILMALQEPDIDIDEAIVNYERGLVLSDQITAKLETAENTITTLRQRFDKDA